MDSHEHWLRRELARWRTEGLVDADLEARLLARYPLPPERAWGRLVFSAIGAVLMGLGVTLFFAYNWNDIPKVAKLGLVFAALLGAHGGAMGLARRPGAPPGLVEGLHVLGTMLFGAGIWLVAQIYHIDEHYPTGYLAWALGALAMAWAMPSIVQALLALALVATWAWVEAFDFRAPMHAAPILAAVGTLPLAWWRRSPALLFCGLAVTLGVAALSVAGVEGDALLPVLVALGTAVVAFGLGSAATDFPGAEPPARAVGLSAAVLGVYVLTFRAAGETLGRVDLALPVVQAHFAAAAAALVGGAWLLWRRGLDDMPRTTVWQVGLLGLATFIAVAIVASRSAVHGWPVALAFNAFALGLAVLTIVDGSERLRPRVVGGGCALFALVTVSRYADLFGSLLARAAVFVVLGAGLFVVGNFYARQRRRAEGAPR